MREMMPDQHFAASRFVIPVMPEMTLTTSDRWALWFGCCLVALLLTPYWAYWFFNSPMVELWNEVSGGSFFPAGQQGNRFQYLTNLVIAPRENHVHVKCVLCSITVRGTVGTAATFWGDVTVESGGSVGRANVWGGRITLMPGAGVWMPTLFAYGGPVVVDESIRVNSNLILSSPRTFYPGQRSWPIEGVAIFVIVLLLTSACGGGLVWGRLRERVKGAVGRPGTSALLGIALLVLLPFLIFLAYVAFPPLALLLMFLTPIPYWVIFVIGFAAVSQQLGSLLGFAHPLSARFSGAGVLIALMLFPIVGLFAMVAVTLVALGAGTSILLGRRREVGLTSSP
jgi:hypothetical protein